MLEGIKKPSEESIASYFVGLTTNGFQWYCSVQYSKLYGFISVDTAQNKTLINSKRFFEKYLCPTAFKDLDEIDCLEIAYELENHREIMKFSAEIWKEGFKENLPLNLHAVSSTFNRPISDESIISFFIGVLWWISKKDFHRDEKMDYILKQAQIKFCPDFSDERRIELDHYFWDDDKIADLRITALDQMEMREMVSPNKLKEFEKSD